MDRLVWTAGDASFEKPPVGVYLRLLPRSRQTPKDLGLSHRKLRQLPDPGSRLVLESQVGLVPCAALAVGVGQEPGSRWCETYVVVMGIEVAVVHLTNT